MAAASGVAERLAWVQRYEQTGDAASVCRAFGITAPTLRKWWRRYRDAGVAGLADASRAPHHSPNRKIGPAEAARIRALHAAGLGLLRIRAALLAERGLDVAVPTIRKALRPAAPSPAPARPVVPAAPSLFAGSLPDDALARAIAAAITAGAFAPGERLTEEALGQRFRAGRGRVRAALRALAMIGLVRIERHRGAVVAMPSRAEVAAAYAARRSIEAVIVRDLARRRTPAQLAALRRHLRRQAEAEQRGDRMALVHLLTEFHLLLASLGANRFLHGFVETLASTTSLAVLLYDHAAIPSCAVAEHGELIRLLERGDGDAAAALMARHLDHNEERQDGHEEPRRAPAPRDGAGAPAGRAT